MNLSQLKELRKMDSLLQSQAQTQQNGAPPCQPYSLVERGTHPLLVSQNHTAPETESHHSTLPPFPVRGNKS